VIKPKATDDHLDGQPSRGRGLVAKTKLQAAVDELGTGNDADGDQGESSDPPEEDIFGATATGTAPPATSAVAQAEPKPKKAVATSGPKVRGLLFYALVFILFYFILFYFFIK
jgi:hypothetical protein